MNRDRQEKKGGEQRQTGEEGRLTDTDRGRRAVNRDRQRKKGCEQRQTGEEGR